MKGARATGGRLLGLLAGALLLSCASRGVEVREYVLTSGAKPGPGDSTGPAIGVGPVRVPSYLRRSEIVTRVGANELRLSDTHRWGEDLDRGLARVVADNLAVQVPGARVGAFPWRQRDLVDFRVSIDVERFEQAPDGSVVLEARWALFQGRDATPLRQERAQIREERAGPSPADSVAAMSRAAAGLSQQIADAIRTAPAAGGPRPRR